MKTKELLNRVNVLNGLKVVEEDDRLCFYEEDGYFPFYKILKTASDFGEGASQLGNLDDVTVSVMVCFIDAVREYLETPLEEREEPKLYNVKFPGITRGGNPIYLARDTGENDRLGMDWSSKDYIEKIKSQFAFTEQEIKDINWSYWEFAEEVEA